MNKQEKFWKNEGGDAYHKRNRVDWVKRVPFWREILELTSARSVFEIGCGPGWNLSAIRAVVPDRADLRNITEVAGLEINLDACRNAWACDIEVFTHMPGDWEDGPTYDLVFTAGVLIHQEDPRQMMQQAIDLSSDYVLAIEYESAKEREIHYQGQSGLCWARPYGKMYQDLGLKPVMVADAGSGFDNCTAWLMRR